MFCGGGHRTAELAEHAAKRVARVAPASVGQHVPRPAQRVVHLLEPELTQIPRDRRLRHPAACVLEGGQELELRPDPLAGHDARDQALPLGLPQDLVLHTGALLSPHQGRYGCTMLRLTVSPTSAEPGNGPSPWLVLGGAIVGGFLIAKVIDWSCNVRERS